MSVPDEILRGRDPDELDRAERRELLSAYMDDELTADDAKIVTAWLDENPGALREVEHIRRTWDLLDHYEDEPVPEGFAARVFDAVGVQNGKVVQMAWYRQPVAWASAAAAVLVAVGVTLFATSARAPVTPAPVEVSTEILNTVPDELVEHIDLLVDLDTVDFEAALADVADLDTDQGG